MNNENTLSVTERPVTEGCLLPLPRLFACFERSELGFFTVDSPQFSETAQNNTRRWEVVDSEWFARVRGLIERSMASPKSLEKLFAVVDLYDRARARVGQMGFHTGEGGSGGGQGQSGMQPGGEGGGFGRRVDPVAWAAMWGGTEADLVEVLEVERRVDAFRRERDLDLDEIDVWAADERRFARRWGLDESTNGTADAHIGGPGRQGRWGTAHVELPAVGSVVELGKSLESFGGFISPGPVTIAAAYTDGCGAAFVSLSRDGRVLATGVTWPISA